ncbi:hypothetical protein EWM64_g4389 [Hericium alpestre]|uniref:Terpene synthase n=1 Tax=Hericium alpestre TaxID=135208 RepID=A0A4Z0A1C1_9AGAM|nr:hypothetical protein EWM64_g4389 [Hericium alpestre]
MALDGAQNLPSGTPLLVNNERLNPFPENAISHAEIKQVLEDFLRRFGYVHTITDIVDKIGALTEVCVDTAVSRGYIVAKDDPLLKAIPVGAEFAYIGYAHRPDEDVKLYITLYTAFLVYIDDTFERDPDAWREFCGRLIRGLPQRDRVSEHAASLIYGCPSPSLDHELKGITLPPSASRYPEWSRVYSGAAEAFSLFIFSSDVPLNVYLPAMPDLAFFINYVNDLFSFYKEALQGDVVNYVFSLARSRGICPTVVLQELADDLLAAHRRILDTLRPHKLAYDMYSEFSNNYVGFHLVSKRYKLEDLGMVSFIMQEV